MTRLFRATLLLATAAVFGPACGAENAEQLVRIGVFDSEDSGAAARWAGTSEYLERRVPGYDFEFALLDVDEIRRQLDNERLEFVLIDPGLFIDLEYKYGLTPVATRRVLTHGQPQSYFGAVILVRADRTDIARLADLKGKSFMAAHAPFGSFHLAWRELQQSAIQPFRDLATVVLDRDGPERIVYALRDGTVDAAAIPTGVLERMSARGAVDAQTFRVLSARLETEDFPYVRSTPLYPEWPLAATVKTSRALARDIAQTLAAMAPDDPAAQTGAYAGWSSPSSYESVDQLYKELPLGPYREEPILASAREHWPVLLAGALLVVTLIVVATHALRTNRRLAEEFRAGARAREQLQTFASAVEQTTDTVIITDPNGLIEYVNPAFSRLTGYSPDEVRGRTPSFLKSGQHDPLFYKRLWDTIGRGDVYNDELVNRRKDGTLFWEQKSIIPLRDASGRISHFVATGRDVTEQRRAEEEVQLRREQLAHTARVNIIGEMASSLAHEISQPLTAIINYAQGSLRRLRAEDMDRNRLLGVLEQIVAQAQRVTDAIVTLRRFVARRRPQRVQADVNALIAQVTALAAGETRGRGISIALELADNLPPATVDDVQMEQVILNLLRNGAEALASADTARELKVRTALTEDGSIEVSISDTGPGLPPRLAAKLFEPFFTTKPDGVGLGLAISRSIIETHGGRIWVTPNPERGVTFRFTVPVETQTHEG